MVDLLSQCQGIGRSITTFNSMNRPINLTSLATMEAILQYSASAKLWDKMDYFLNFEEMGENPNLMR